MALFMDCFEIRSVSPSQQCFEQITTCLLDTVIGYLKDAQNRRYALENPDAKYFRKM